MSYKLIILLSTLVASVSGFGNELNLCESAYIGSKCQGQMLHVLEGERQPRQVWIQDQTGEVYAGGHYVCSSPMTEIKIARCGSCENFDLINYDEMESELGGNTVEGYYSTKVYKQLEITEKGTCPINF